METVPYRPVFPAIGSFTSLEPRSTQSANLAWGSIHPLCSFSVTKMVIKSLLLFAFLASRLLQSEHPENWSDYITALL